MSDPDYNYIRVRADTTTDPLIRRLTDPPFGTETSERNLMAAAARHLLDAWAERDAAQADAEAAVALALEEAAEVVKALWKWDDEGWQVERPSQPQAEAALRALAPPAGVAKLAELRAERDEAVSTLAYCEKQWTDTDRITHAKMLDERARADTLAAELAACKEREAGLRKALTPFAFYSEESNTTQEAWEIRYRDRFQDWIDFEDIANARAALAQVPAPTEEG